MRTSFSRAVALTGALLFVTSACASKQRTSTPESRDNSTVTAEEIERQGATDQPIEKVLQGRIAGVSVTRAADGGIAVRIRGATSFHGNSEPLYILDGMPIQPGPTGSLTGINPSDIESIKVLKDAAETAMYGVRGANGVIIIKTKRPPKPST
jgi:TonB-dependent SusC/RagA subfamily outer membrane receptor